MMAHTHKKTAERGPYGCADNVSYTQTCQCGAEKRVCFCTQCKSQGTNKSQWTMPQCRCCNLRHPLDQSCPVGYTSDF